MHMHMIMAANSLMPLPCACANLRRASRAVTQLYDEALRGSGLRITQFTLLQFLAQLQKPVTQGALGTQLALDSTTLSRTLKPLVRARWIRTSTGSDGRERPWVVTVYVLNRGQLTLMSWPRRRSLFERERR